MSLDVAEENSEIELLRQDIAEPDYEQFNDLTTEHVVIEADISEQDKKPLVVRQRQLLNNPLHGTVTEVTFYEEGFLKIRAGSKNDVLKEHVLELRFIDPKPFTVRKIAMPCLWSSLALGTTALLGPVLIPMTRFSQFVAPASIAMAVVAVAMFLAFVYRSKVNHQFRTASGKSEVVSLSGALGCFRRARVLALQIQKDIERACSETGTHDIRYLREEMQAHYKLAETGVITREECSDGTALILSKFG